MKDESITVVTVGKPDISAMSSGEKDTLFAALLARMRALSEEQGTELSVQRGSLCRTGTQKFTTTEATL